jgi:hypothetical protein
VAGSPCNRAQACVRTAELPARNVQAIENGWRISLSENALMQGGSGVLLRLLCKKALEFR